MWRAACLAALIAVGCGRVATEGSDSSSKGATLAGGNTQAPPDDPTAGTGKDDPGANAGTGQPPSPECQALEEKVTYCKLNNLPCDDVFAALSACDAPGAGASNDCQALEDKMTYCKLNGLPCDDVLDALIKCSGPSAPPAADPCEGYGLLYKDCIVTHPGDPFCDRVLAAYDLCENTK